MSDELKVYFVTRCDKCGEKVYPSNSALLLDEIVDGFAGYVKNRHLYPTATCQGSPSRVRRMETDRQWQEAYQKMQVMEFELIDSSEEQ
jgi:hypothetical protein